MSSRRLAVPLLLLIAVGVWVAVAWRYASLTTPPGSALTAAAPPVATGTARPYRYVPDHPDPFYYGPAAPPPPGVPSLASGIARASDDRPRDPWDAGAGTAFGPPPVGFDLSTPLPAAPAPPASPPLPAFRVTAVLGRTGSPAQTAVLEAPDGTSFVVRVGDWLGPLRVDRIAPDRVVLVRPGSDERHTFTLSG